MMKGEEDEEKGMDGPGDAHWAEEEDEMRVADNSSYDSQQTDHSQEVDDLNSDAGRIFVDEEFQSHFWSQWRGDGDDSLELEEEGEV